MIKEDFMGQADRKFKPSRKPIIKKYEIQESQLDPELRKLKHIMLRPTPYNREYCFWNDSISQSYSYITAATIIGDGIRVRCDNIQAKEIILGWNDEINVNRKSIEDYITSSWIDELVHANSYWRVENNKDLAYKIDIQRVDPKTITKIKDPKYGWTKLLQSAFDYKSYASKAAFYKKAGRFDNYYVNLSKKGYKEVHIPDEPNVMLRTSFFIEPPIASATHYIAYKRFILYFMRKYAQKLWTPFILFLIGDTKSNYYPDEDEEMQDAINDMSEIIPEMVNFGGAAIPGNVQPMELGQQTARSSEVYIHYMEALDKQIMMSLFSSMGLREASGSELATGRSLKDGWHQFIRGIRRRYNISLNNFYTRCLLPANGINLSPRELNLEFPPLAMDTAQQEMAAIKTGWETGLFKDRNEMRKAGQRVYSWMEELPPGENKLIKFESMADQKQTPFGSPFGKKTDTINSYRRYLEIDKI